MNLNRYRTDVIVAALLLCAVVVASGCVPGGDSVKPKSSAPVPPVPAVFATRDATAPIRGNVSLDADIVALGKRLFHDKRLSGDDTISCASCHDLGKGGTDQEGHSRGVGAAVGGINAPTVLNSGLNFVQFWNGRAATLEDQVEGPTHHPKEMASNWKQIIGKLSKDDAYVRAFEKSYGPGAIEPARIKNAIATFERSLTTPNSAFDRFLDGDTTALDSHARNGWRLFQEFGCVSCHQGTNLGGNLYQKIGIMADYFKERGTPIDDADLGRFTVTHDERDRHAFRVPPLRNVALTHPYFHDASVETLPEAVQVMAHYQLGRVISPSELNDLVRFLESLTGEQPHAQ